MAVNEREAMDQDTMKFGLLMESAQAHQKLAEAHLEKLRAHTQDLDAVVRDEIRRTLVDELQAVTAESERAARALRAMKQAAHMRGLLWNAGTALICAVVPVAVAHLVLPTPAEIIALQTRHDALAKSVASLEQRGGKIDWKSCGDSARLCVRIDRNAPVYGANADYYVAKGY